MHSLSTYLHSPSHLAFTVSSSSKVKGHLTKRSKSGVKGSLPHSQRGLRLPKFRPGQVFCKPYVSKSKCRCRCGIGCVESSWSMEVSTEISTRCQSNFVKVPGDFAEAAKVDKGGNSTCRKIISTAAFNHETSPVPSEGQQPMELEQNRKPGLRVAVIGAGAAGLAAARELLREGHQVEVFEQGSEVGGVWVYDDLTESDPLGLSSSREAVHSSMYASLRTNLPRECMSFLDFPFTAPPGSSDSSRYCTHQTVCLYLQHFAEVFGLLPHVRFRSRVEKVTPEHPVSRQFPAESRPGEAQALSSSCNGVGLANQDAGKAAEDFIGRARDSIEEGELLSASPTAKRNHWIQWRVETSRVTSSESNIDDANGGENKGLSLNSQACREGVTSSERGRMDKTEVYDAVVICNGHYSQPKIASVPGIETWPGRQIHSHNYRRPEPFTGLVVVILGAASSGEDIARETAGTAREVHLCSRGWTAEEVPGSPEGKHRNLWRHPMVVKAHSDGRVDFGDGSNVHADVILHCTGYVYHFPFLRGVEPWFGVEDARVGPLYEHVFPLHLAPTLSLVGIPWQVAPFPLMEIQAKWIAKVLAGKITLPSPQEMEAEVQSFYGQMEAAGVPQRYSHAMGSTAVVGQFEYLDGILERCGLPPLDRWRRGMYAAASLNKRSNPDNYRETWTDYDILAEAVASQAKILEANPHWYGFCLLGRKLPSARKRLSPFISFVSLVPFWPLCQVRRLPSLGPSRESLRLPDLSRFSSCYFCIGISTSQCVIFLESSFPEKVSAYESRLSWCT